MLLLLPDASSPRLIRKPDNPMEKPVGLETYVVSQEPRKADRKGRSIRARASPPPFSSSSYLNSLAAWGLHPQFAEKLRDVLGMMGKMVPCKIQEQGRSPDVPPAPWLTIQLLQVHGYQEEQQR